MANLAKIIRIYYEAKIPGNFRVNPQHLLRHVCQSAATSGRKSARPNNYDCRVGDCQFRP